MSQNLGNRTEDSIIDFKWGTNGADGEAITRAANGTVSVYKANDTSQSTAGVTDSEDFDSITGVHHCRIDTSADAFYEVGKDYQVVLSAATIDGQVVNVPLAAFTIEYGFNEVDVVKWLGSAVATPTVAGVPEVDATHIEGGDASNAIAAAVGDIPTVSEIWTTALTEAYRATGGTGTGAQLLYEILQNITEFVITGTTKTTKKLDGSTTAKTYTLNDSANPTGITEAT